MDQTTSTVAATLAVGALMIGALTIGGCSKQAVQPTTSAAPTSAAEPTGPASTSVTTPSSTQPSGAVAAEKPIAPETNPPGDIPDNQAFVRYATTGGFSVKVPEGWSRTVGSSTVEFTDKLNTIRLVWGPASAAPTVANVTSVDAPKLQTSEAAFTLVSVKAVTLPAGPAVLTIYQENSAPNDVTGKRYRLDVERYSVFKNGKRVDLILLSPVGADNVDPWRIVSQSLAWK